MEIVNGQNLTEFAVRFKFDQYCREYLSNIKWTEGNYTRNHIRVVKKQVRASLFYSGSKPIYFFVNWIY